MWSQVESVKIYLSRDDLLWRLMWSVCVNHIVTGLR